MNFSGYLSFAISFNISKYSANVSASITVPQTSISVVWSIFTRLSTADVY